MRFDYSKCEDSYINVHFKPVVRSPHNSKTMNVHCMFRVLLMFCVLLMITLCVLIFTLESNSTYLPRLLVDTNGCKIRDVMHELDEDHNNGSMKALLQKSGSTNFNRKWLFHQEYIGESSCPVLNEEGLQNYNISEHQLDCVYRGVDKGNEDLTQIHWDVFNWRECTPQPFLLIQCILPDDLLYQQVLLLPRIIKERKYVVNELWPYHVAVIGVSGLSNYDFIKYFEKTNKVFRATPSKFTLKGFVRTTEDAKVAQNILLNGKSHFSGIYSSQSNEDTLWNVLTNLGYRHLVIEDNVDNRFHNSSFSDTFPMEFIHQVLNLRSEKYFQENQNDGLFEYLSNPINRLNIVLKYFAGLLNLHGRDRPFFLFSWITHLEDIGYPDLDGAMASFLQSLIDDSLLSDTVFILVSDQGRSCPPEGVYCSLKQQLPVARLILPENFMSLQENYTDILTRNQDRVTSVLDIYTTLRYFASVISDADTNRFLNQSLMAHPVNAEISCTHMENVHLCPCMRTANAYTVI